MSETNNGNGSRDVFDQPTVVIGGPNIAAAAAAAVEGVRADAQERTIIASGSVSQAAGSIGDRKPAAADAKTAMVDPSGIAVGTPSPAPRRAWSARMSMLSALVASSGTQVVIPPESVTTPATGDAGCAIAWLRSVCPSARAKVMAPERGVLGRMSANSSPP